MAGVKQFNEEEALGRALDLFWARGYRATSMLDLAEATGVQRGSLYNAYGDKEKIFLIVLKRYSEAYLARISAAFSGDDLAAALTRYLDACIAIMMAGDPPRGCMTTKTATDTALNGERVHMALKGFLDEVEQAIAGHLATPAFAARLTLPPAEAARLLVTFTRGMAVLERVYQDEKRLHESARSLVKALVR